MPYTCTHVHMYLHTRILRLTLAHTHTHTHTHTNTTIALTVDPLTQVFIINNMKVTSQGNGKKKFSLKKAITTSH